ncbi:TPA: DNA repair and recombination protein RadB [Candidatus Woesearchaeota archaeon]|nr:DNA repair and recombination protein RadB [Candidatus Woesearchaeota archaeon]
MAKISTGAEFLNTFLDGGYDYDIITTIYGPSGSGKTNLCLIAAVTMARSGKKVIFIDTEGGIAVERIKQLAFDYEQILPRLLFWNPLTFTEQKEILDNLRQHINDHIGLIIVDSISMLYRLELGRSEEVYEVNSALGRQMACLVEIARRHKIPVLITNQVYADFEDKTKVKMVGGDLLKYGSKCLIELQRVDGGRTIFLRKHRSLSESKQTAFCITETGIELSSQSKN